MEKFWFVFLWQPYLQAFDRWDWWRPLTHTQTNLVMFTKFHVLYAKRWRWLCSREKTTLMLFGSGLSYQWSKKPNPGCETVSGANLAWSEVVFTVWDITVWTLACETALQRWFSQRWVIYLKTSLACKTCKRPDISRLFNLKKTIDLKDEMSNYFRFDKDRVNEWKLVFDGQTCKLLSV